MTYQIPEPAECLTVLLLGAGRAETAAIVTGLSASPQRRFMVQTAHSVIELSCDTALSAADAVIVWEEKGDDDGAAVVSAVAEALPSAVILAMGPDLGETFALSAIRAGAEDYLIDQPASIAALPRILTYAVERRAMSDRMRRLAAQRRSAETLLSTAFELSATPMALSEQDGSVIIVNQAFAQTFGWTTRAAAGQVLGEAVLAGLGDPAGPIEGRGSLRCQNGETVEMTVRRAATPVDERTLIVWAFVPVVPETALLSGELVPPGPQLADLVAGGPRRLSAGRLQLVTLDEVRHRFGDRWEKWKERAHEMAERTIRKRLGPEDVLSRDGSGAFIVCFAHLDGEAAWFKAQALQREIARQLLGDSGCDQIADVVVETHEIEINPDDAPPGTDLAALIVAKLTRETERLRNEQQRIVMELFREARLEMMPLLTTSGTPSPIIVAGFDRKSKAALGRLLLASSNDSRLTAEIDMMLLGRVAAALTNLLARRPTALVVVTLHATTLQHRHLRDRLYGIFRRFPDVFRRAIVVRVLDIPTDILSARAAELLSPLRALSRFRILELARPDLMNLQLRDCGVSLVEVDYRTLDSVADRDPLHVQRFRNELRINRANLIVTRVPDRQAEAAATFGARFVTFDPDM